MHKLYQHMAARDLKVATEPTPASKTPATVEN